MASSPPKTSITLKKYAYAVYTTTLTPSPHRSFPP